MDDDMIFEADDTAEVGGSAESEQCAPDSAGGAQTVTDTAARAPAAADRGGVQAARDAEIRAFLDAVPNADVKNIPDAVWAGVRSGKSLLTAYLLNENAELKAQLDKSSARALTAGSAASAGAAVSDFDALWYDGD